MSINNTCYENIIGLSQTTSTCWDDDKPADYNTSGSGLYLADLEPISNITDIANSENDDVWDILWHARDNAIKTFIADSNRGLIDRYKLKRPPWTGIIGERKKTAWLTPDKTYMYVRIFSSYMRGAKLTIKKINTLFDTTGTITMYVYNTFNELLGTYTLNTTAEKYTENDITDLELNLTMDGVENADYFLVFEPGAKKPANNLIKCNCGQFKPNFNTDVPYFNRPIMDRKYEWAQWFMVGAGSQNTLDFSDPNVTELDQTFGIYLDIEISCNINDVLCKTTMDYTSNPIAATIAHAVWYKSAVNTLKQVLMSTEISRKAMMNTENTGSYIAHYTKEYDKCLDYIVKAVKLDSYVDCLECKDKWGMTKSRI